MAKGKFETLLPKLAKEGADKPTFDTYCKALLKPAGGLQGLIKRVWQTMDKLGDGHPNSVRLLLGVMDIVKLTAERQQSSTNLDELTPDELRKAVESIDFERVQSTITDDADEAEPIGSSGASERTAVDSEEPAE